MQFTPLQLERSVLTSLHLDANENTHPASSAREHQHVISLKWDFLGRVEEGVRQFKVPMEVSVKCKRPRTCGLSVRALSVGLVGYFSLRQELPPEQRNRHIVLNCLTILYGVARGIVVSATGSMEGGSTMLPALDLTKEVDAWAERQLAASTTPKEESGGSPPSEGT